MQSNSGDPCSYCDGTLRTDDIGNLFCDWCYKSPTNRTFAIRELKEIQKKFMCFDPETLFVILEYIAAGKL